MRNIWVLFLVGGLAVALLASAAGREAFWSAQVAFVSSALVVAASFQSYRRMVLRRLQAGMHPEPGADRDTIEKIEDPYALYDDEPEAPKEESAREALRRQKRLLRSKRRSALATARDSAPAFSLWRLAAYGVLVAGFFFLRDQGLLRLGAYLPSLAVPIVLAIGYLMHTEAGDAASP